MKNTLSVLAVALAAVGLISPCAAGKGRSADEVAQRPLVEQVRAVERRSVRCVELARRAVDSIAATQAPGGVRAFTAVIDDPEQAAQELRQAAHRGARLRCGTIAVKDNIDQAGFPNTAGSLALAGNQIDVDAPLVARLRAHGALLVGRANLSEWANYRSSSATSGWSSVGGQTQNGFDPRYNPCGSSAGSAAAVAAGLVAAAIGTETFGSITCPAAVNGVVGFKPTVGLVSRTGIIPISHTFDTAGPITQTVEDAARILSVIAGPDFVDPATATIPAGLDLDFEAQLAGASLAGARIGVVMNLLGYHRDLDSLFFAEMYRLSQAGAILIPVVLPNYPHYGPAASTVMRYEFKDGLNAYLQAHRRPGQPSSLAELIAWNEEHASEVLVHFGQELLVESNATAGLSAEAYREALQTGPSVAGPQGIGAVLVDQDLDALTAPTTGPAWTTNYEIGDEFLGGCSGPAAVAGYPHITVPMGMVEGRPVGLSLFAAAWQDATVLRLAHAYETLPR